MKFREELTVNSRWLKETTISIQCDHSESMSIPNEVKRKNHEIGLWYTKTADSICINSWHSTMKQYNIEPIYVFSLYCNVFVSQMGSTDYKQYSCQSNVLFLLFFHLASYYIYVLTKMHDIGLINVHKKFERVAHQEY